jgi:hypothetical protein
LDGKSYFYLVKWVTQENNPSSPIVLAFGLRS